jgi:hypothetical protein
MIIYLKQYSPTKTKLHLNLKLIFSLREYSWKYQKISENIITFAEQNKNIFYFFVKIIVKSFVSFIWVNQIFKHWLKVLQ